MLCSSGSRGAKSPLAKEVPELQNWRLGESFMDGKGWAFDPALYGYSDVLPHSYSALREETKCHNESLSGVQLSHAS